LTLLLLTIKMKELTLDRSESCQLRIEEAGQVFGCKDVGRQVGKLSEEIGSNQLKKRQIARRRRITYVSSSHRKSTACRNVSRTVLSGNDTTTKEATGTHSSYLLSERAAVQFHRHVQSLPNVPSKPRVHMESPRHDSNRVCYRKKSHFLNE
jgi:hypothetical protein